jgi:hypothetical protein
MDEGTLKTPIHKCLFYWSFLFEVVKQFCGFWIWSETECKTPAEYGLQHNSTYSSLSSSSVFVAVDVGCLFSFDIFFLVPSSASVTLQKRILLRRYHHHNFFNTTEKGNHTVREFLETELLYCKSNFTKISDLKGQCHEILNYRCCSLIIPLVYHWY